MKKFPLFLCFFLLIFSLVFADPKVVRAAIDIGSGATKLRIAEVDLGKNTIDKILVNQSFAVPYQESYMNNPQGLFDEKVMYQGLEAMKKIREIANNYKVKQVIGIATAAFRKAGNAQEFIDRIYRETGIKIFIVDQDTEGEMAFEAARGELGGNLSDVIVWDIGGGSFQFTMMNPQGKLLIYRGHEASVPFKNFVIQEIQKKNTKEFNTPNPMTTKEISQAELHARLIAQKVDNIFKEKIQNPFARVVGVGNVFSYGVYDLMGKQPFFSYNQLDKAVRGLAGKTDQDMGGGDFSNVAVTNPILILGFMDTLHIPRVDIIDVNNADGAMLMSAFWLENEPIQNVSSVPAYCCYCHCYCRGGVL